MAVRSARQVTKNESTTKWRAIALGLLEKYSITTPADLDIEAIAEAEGVKIISKRLTDCEGRLISGKKGPRIVVDSGIKQAGKKRFVVAHELGHHLQQDRKSQAHVCLDASQSVLYTTDPQEAEANTFAAEILMPKPWCVPLLHARKPDFAIVRQLATDLSTTLTAAAFRFVLLTTEPCALVASQDGRIKWYVRSSDSWYYRIRARGSELSKYSYAYDLFNDGKEQSRVSTVDAEAWLDMPNLKEDATIYEHSIEIGQYGILSLLWVNEDPTVYRAE